MRSVPVATFRNLPDGKEGSASFRVVGDNSFELSGELADGDTVGRQLRVSHDRKLRRLPPLHYPKERTDRLHSVSCS